MIDAQGGSAAWTGSKTPDWSGHRTGPDHAVQGNRLVGPETVDAVVERFEANEAQEHREQESPPTGRRSSPGHPEDDPAAMERSDRTDVD